MGNSIGVTAGGTARKANGTGIEIRNGARGNALVGNVISGNSGIGVLITGSGTTGNMLTGSAIGTDASGLYTLPNAFGVLVTNGARGNTIGGATAAARNVISGNNDTGVVLSGPGTSTNVVAGNSIGTDLTGTLPSGNMFRGVFVDNGASNNTVAGNVISSNGFYGVQVNGANTTGNALTGNRIGTDAAGLHPLGSLYGVLVSGAAHGNTIGGTTAAARQRHLRQQQPRRRAHRRRDDGQRGGGELHRHRRHRHAPLGNQDPRRASSATGVEQHRRRADGRRRQRHLGQRAIRRDPRRRRPTSNVVAGNLIGTDKSGLHAVPNAFGVFLTGSTVANTIGGTTAAARNVISGNSDSGVVLSGPGVGTNWVWGNYIGTTAGGSAPLGNRNSGVIINHGANYNEIGNGPSDGTGNVISGNGSIGVLVTDPGTVNNYIGGNKIGTDRTGGFARGNGAEGVEIAGGACPHVRRRQCHLGQRR